MKNIVNKNILELNNIEAKKFFLENESYSNIFLPKYFNFENLLNKLSDYIGDNSISNYYQEKKPLDYSDVNHVIVGNKDGKYSWRSYDLINPVLYVDLVNIITSPVNWECIKKHLNNTDITNIECLSLPVRSTNSKKTDTSEQILNWWKSIEQKSLEFALEYNYMILSDISNCYDSIYTHSISWAMHGIEKSKNNKWDNDLLGNKIDSSIRSMRYGQTNGIPTGSVIMDLIAEIVLAGIDKQMNTRLEDEIPNDDYRILRYRDDYKIFFNKDIDGDKILKILSEEVHIYNFKLHPGKTKKTSDIISSSVKPDKISFLEINKEFKTIQKELLVIYKFTKSFPNSGAIFAALNDLYKKIKKENKNKNKKNSENKNILISIIVQIMFENPKIIKTGIGLISLILDGEDKNNTKLIIGKIIKKFSVIPNTDLLDIFLQRLSLKVDKKYPYSAKLTKQLYVDDCNKIWNMEWVEDKKIANIIKNASIIDKDYLRDMKAIISEDEFNIFAY